MDGWSTALGHWYEANKRDLPWRQTQNPYFIWLSEVILQQTRVQQGLPYYRRFIEEFPTVGHLANAPLEKVLSCWQGLGYYSRARNLHEAAKQIVLHFGGEFPHNYNDIRKLKGIGPYTAAAIASFSFGLPHAVVDGNVYRVLSRHFGIHEAIDTPAGQRLFANLAQRLLPVDQPALYNQSIMEFGALQCVPVKPACESCIFNQSCSAFQENKVDLLPVKIGKIKQTERFFNFLVLRNKDGVYMMERTQKDIWQHLWQFYLEETGGLLEEEEIVMLLKQKFSLSHGDFEVLGVSDAFKHLLTHQRLYAKFWLVQIFSNLQSKELIFVPYDQLGSKPLPRLIDKYIKKHPTWLDSTK